SKFKCPCHGSGFRLTGINFEGPAPRPLERARVVLADDGQILVDKSRHFQFELGQWIDPEALLKACKTYEPRSTRRSIRLGLVLRVLRVLRSGEFVLGHMADTKTVAPKESGLERFW